MLMFGLLIMIVWLKGGSRAESAFGIYRPTRPLYNFYSFIYDYLNKIMSLN